MSALDAFSRAINLTLKAKKTSVLEAQTCVVLLVKSLRVPDKEVVQIKGKTEEDHS